MKKEGMSNVSRPFTRNVREENRSGRPGMVAANEYSAGGIMEKLGAARDGAYCEREGVKAFLDWMER